MGKWNKGIILTMILLLTVTIFLSGCNGSEKEVVAKVNGAEISQSQLDKYVDYRKKESELSGYISSDMWEDKIEGSNKTYEDQLIESSLEDLINQEVLLQKAEELDIKIDDKDVEKELEQFKSTDENAKSFNEYLDSIGISEDYFKQMYKESMIITALIEETVDISDKEAEKFYEENVDTYDKVEASHILLESKEEAEKVKKKLDSGEDFSELAKEYSQDGSAENGGNLGYFARPQMASEFSDVAFDLEKEEVSDVVKTKSGYHIIKVTDKKLGFKSNKEEIISELQNQKFNEKALELIEKADIERILEFEDDTEEKDEDDTKSTDDAENAEEDSE
ncbi:peptidylprolyl isomerase [Clostridium sp. D2Q-14]|uniref:peptidylprolyl isomerase n=1 Tax=Anaeromonas gelatinilytica TaxID=2683194 RepID=UPI00193B4249|nr:peptidylprolyl isomerase [Anaeromonas gelatinilytica]MBS4534682.1 peptidylprolyl isomerase [Anaeromonas gelatinilytica]